MRVSKRHKRAATNLVKVFVFFFLLIFQFSALSIITEKALIRDDSLVPGRNKNFYRVLREPENSIDIVFLGDSLCYSAFSPMNLWKEYGYTSFSCGQAGQKIWETEDMFRTVLKAQKPRLVILETNVLFRDHSRGRKLNDTIEVTLNNYIPVFRGHDVWKSLITKKEYKQEDFKGFVLRTAVKPYTEGGYMKKTEKKKKLSDTALTHLKTIMNLCEANDAELLLVSSPSPINHTYAKHNALSEYAEKQHLTYIDMNLCLDEIGINWQTDSADHGDHLNISGAVKVTNYLGKYLAEKYTLPDHRKQKTFASWTKEYEIYDNKAAKYLAEIRGDRK